MVVNIPIGVTTPSGEPAEIELHIQVESINMPFGMHHID
jgi:hypothetical protein